MRGRGDLVSFGAGRRRRCAEDGRVEELMGGDRVAIVRGGRSGARVGADGLGRRLLVQGGAGGDGRRARELGDHGGVSQGVDGELQGPGAVDGDRPALHCLCRPRCSRDPLGVGGVPGVGPPLLGDDDSWSVLGLELVGCIEQQEEVLLA